MSDDNNGLDAQQNGDDELDLSTLDPRVRGIITRTRKEAETWRKKLREAEDAARKQDDIRLQEEGKWRDLYEQREKDVLRLKPFEEGYTQLNALLEEGNKKIIATLPTHLQAMVPDYPAEKKRAWLDANVPILTKPIAPDLNQGAGGSGGGNATPQLTAEELAIAQSMRVSPEEFAKYKPKG